MPRAMTPPTRPGSTKSRPGSPRSGFAVDATGGGIKRCIGGPRFWSAHSGLDDMLASVREAFADLSIRCSITGGPTAHLLQKFYRGLELPIFVDSFPDQLRRRLRIIPDKSGPLIFLRSFGDVPFWRETEPFPLAHPWLIYSELMYSFDPRAHEAAEEIKREFFP